MFNFTFVLVILTLSSVCLGLPNSIEINALLQFKKNVQPTTSFKLREWHENNMAQVCKWQGIICDSSLQHVVSVDVSTQTFINTPWEEYNSSSDYLFLTTNSITPLFVHLQHLHTLILAHNFIFGEIPMTLSNCTQLQILNFSYLNLNGIIPKFLGNLKKLKVLDLSHNDLSGEIPSQLGQLRELKVLDLSSNSLNGTIPIELTSCSKLQVLRLFGNYFNESSFPIWLHKLNNLQNLSLGYGYWQDGQTYLPAQIPNFLRNFSLVHLELNGCNFVGEIPNFLMTMSSLEHLDLSYNNLVGFTKTIIQLPRLQYLDLSFNNFSGEIPMTMANLIGLTFLNLRNNKFTGNLNFLINLKSLQGLNLAFNKFNGGISQVSNLHNLVYLSLHMNHFEDNLSWLQNLTNISYLLLSNNAFFGSTQWVSGMLNMKKLDLSYNNLKSFVNMTWLYMSYNQSSSPIFKYQYDDWIFIDVSHNMLTGGIPDFSSIEKQLYIDISYNQLQGPIPKSISNLDCFIASNNSLSGHLPLLNNSSKLSTLVLFSNNLNGQLSVSPSLIQYDVSDNDFDGQLPQNICNLSSLEILSVAYNKLEGNIPTCINNLTQLFTLDLSNNNFKGQLPPNLTQLQGLKFIAWGYFRDTQSEFGININGQRRVYRRPYSAGVFDVSNNLLEGNIPVEFGQLVGLWVLNLSFNMFVGGVPSQIGNMNNLQYLDVSHNKLQGAIPQELCQIKQLAILNVSHNNLSGPIPTCNAFNTKYPPDSFYDNPNICVPCSALTGYQIDILHCCSNGTLQSQLGAKYKKTNSLFDKISPWGFVFGFLIGFPAALLVAFQI